MTIWSVVKFATAHDNTVLFSFDCQLVAFQRMPGEFFEVSLLMWQGCRDKTWFLGKRETQEKASQLGSSTVSTQEKRFHCWRNSIKPHCWDPHVVPKWTIQRFAGLVPEIFNRTASCFLFCELQGICYTVLEEKAVYEQCQVDRPIKIPFYLAVLTTKNQTVCQLKTQLFTPGC